MRFMVRLSVRAFISRNRQKSTSHLPSAQIGCDPSAVFLQSKFDSPFKTAPSCGSEEKFSLDENSPPLFTSCFLSLPPSLLPSFSSFLPFLPSVRPVLSPPPSVRPSVRASAARRVRASAEGARFSEDVAVGECGGGMRGRAAWRRRAG